MASPSNCHDKAPDGCNYKIVAINGHDRSRELVITLPPHLESALAAQAQLRGVTPEILALDLLREYLLPQPPRAPIDKWERRVFAAAVDCGVSFTDSALSSDGLYK